MKKINYKFMDAAQQAEIDALWPEHGEAIMAYVKDCVRGYKIGEAYGFLLTVAGGFVIGSVAIIGKKVYHKLTDNKEPTEKPGRVLEA